MRRRPLLFVGMAPSSNSDPRAPLDCASGRTLARLFGHRHIGEFAVAVNVLDRYPGRANKKGDKFPMRKARRSALRVAESFAKYKVVVVLGRGPARVFELEWFKWSKVFGAHVAAMPHTSGANHWWNEPANRKRAKAFARAVMRKATRG